jgi:two-component system phosphate regulon response regulator PhoB
MPASILIVEDEPAILELVAINLEHAGYDTLRAKDAEEAADLLTRVLPDVVLLDWMLPGQSGMSLARRLRADSRTRELPIIFLTARAEELDKVAGLEVGADDYITAVLDEAVAHPRLAAPQKAPPGQAPVEIAGCDRSGGAQGQRQWPGACPRTDRVRLLHYAAHPNRVYTRTQLMDEIWGDQVIIEERTVDVHIRRLRQALSPSGHDALIETVRGRLRIAHWPARQGVRE